MTTKLEQAARKALEALEEWKSEYNCNDDDEAIAALREALAEQAEQEPVAWLWVNEHGSKRLEWEPVEDTSKWKSTPLYAAPVRTKDLTDDEIVDVMNKIYGSMWTEQDRDFARAVIAADREKNK